MATQEVPLLPAGSSETGPAALEANGVPMVEGVIPGVLMLRTAAVSHRAMRGAVQRAGLGLPVEIVSNRREFLEELRRGETAVIVAGAEALPGMDLREIMDRARGAQPAIPVVLIGDDRAEREFLKTVGEGAAEYLSVDEIEHLPLVLNRALRVREASTAQARAEGELVRVAGLLRENQKLITLGRLTASIAHEINNPLESVTNLLYLLGKEKDLSGSARGYLEVAQRELERAGQICRQTLNFSRETKAPVPTRIDSLLDEVLALLGRRIADKNLQVERQYECEEEATVFPGEMRQVLSNLVTNAIEASSVEGKLRVRVRCSRSWSEKGVRGIRISVGDSGSGIPAEVQRRLGEAFFTTKGQKGTGLGLWVTRSIVQRYGGEIHLRSSVGRRRHGTVFSVFLPLNLGPRAVGQRGGSGDGGADSTSSRVVEMERNLLRRRANEGPTRRQVNGC